ncbi:uncharacterized protein B0T15DRAFT_514104 [Chaetomium strumarium]|uniref:Uncharacterized protein n=1 Tax=Chaetomium strumarium TaxID=1170767 RepID=A0AAJ0GLB4_9PEZI|nr:hypothetical protein B0T15DRAFT_514104 [Chaetomium strumarium]
MGKITTIAKRPFAAVHQAFIDYQLGRRLRKGLDKTTKEPEQREFCCEEHITEDSGLQQPNGIEDAAPPPMTTCKDENNEVEQQLDSKGNAVPPAVGKDEPYERGAEFPWRLQQMVHEESNWRGTWILEVKDMQAMVWETERVPNHESGRAKYQRTATWQLPFPPEGPLPDRTFPNAGGQDDLMVWLGKA